MKVWIVNPYGTLPGEGWREYRTYMLAKAMALLGHEVIWWISDFEHRNKTHRNQYASQSCSLEKNIHINFVHSTSYKSNISLARVNYEITFGKNFYRAAQIQDKPDMIVLAVPSLFFARYVTNYVKKLDKCKLILDVLDLWPEMFNVVLPTKIKSLGRLIFYPFYCMRNSLVNSADAIVGVTSDYIDVVSSNTNKLTPHFVSYLGVNLAEFDRDLQSFHHPDVKAFVSSAELVVVYSGSFGKAYDMDVLIDSIKQIVLLKRRVKFVIVGDGPFKDRLESLAYACKDDVLFLGLISANQLPSIYQYCDIGLCTYAEGSTVSMPVKIYDYFAAGLIVIHSLVREAKLLVESNNVGSIYKASSSESLTIQILGLLGDKAKLEEMKKNSKQLAKQFDSVEQHLALANFLTSLLAEKKIYA